MEGDISGGSNQKNEKLIPFRNMYNSHLDERHFTGWTPNPFTFSLVGLMIDLDT